MADYEYFRKTLRDLQNGAAAVEMPVQNLRSASELSRLFDMCFQQACQAIRMTADPDNQFPADFISASDYLKMGFEKELIDDEEGWIEMLEASRHYESCEDPDAFWQTAAQIPRFIVLLNDFLKGLEKRLQ